MDHISTGSCWGFTGRKHHAKILPPYIGEADSDWYAGTADAIYQNLNFISRFSPDFVFVLSGDHIYHMDYNELFEYHLSKKADVTIAMQKVPFEDVERFGVAVTDEDGRMIDFIEKSKTTPTNLASLGIYLFNRKFLEDILIDDAALKTSRHDFGKDIIPKIMKKHRVYCFTLDKYWQDVGTIEAYWKTQQEILNPQSGLDLAGWGVRTNLSLEDLAILMPLKIMSKARIHNSIISPGCIIEGEVINSILSPGVHVKTGAKVEKSVIMNNAVLGENSRVSHVILDKNIKIGKDCAVGVGELIPNKETPHLLSCGITVFGKNTVLPDHFTVGKNCLIYPDLKEADYRKDAIPSGDTIKPLTKDRLVSGRKFQQYKQGEDG